MKTFIFEVSVRKVIKYEIAANNLETAQAAFDDGVDLTDNIIEEDVVDFHLLDITEEE